MNPMKKASSPQPSPPEEERENSARRLSSRAQCANEARGGLSRWLDPLPFPSPRPAVGRTRDAVDHPDVPGEGDHVSFVLDKLERGRLVQTSHDCGQGAV